MIALATILEATLPIGGPSWNEIALRFKEWAEAHGRPVRDTTALRAKYQKMISGKPTGVGGYSDLQKRFRAIEVCAHEAAGGSRLHDGDEAAESGSDLDGNALADALQEVDAISNKRMACYDA